MKENKVEGVFKYETLNGRAYDMVVMIETLGRLGLIKNLWWIYLMGNEYGIKVVVTL